MATLNINKEKTRLKRNIIFFIILFLFLVIVTPWIVSLLYQFLTTFNVQTFEFGIINKTYMFAFQLFIKDRSIKFVSTSLVILIFAIIFMMTMSMKPKIGKTETIQITHNIEIPVAVGNGQHGNARFLSMQEKKEILSEVIIKKGSHDFPKLEGKTGLLLDAKEEKKTEVLKYLKEDHHSLTDGITGSGKNRRVIFKSIFLNFLFGTSLFVNDVKGENYYYTSELAKTFHYQVYALDLRNPKKSVHYNFLQPIINAYEDKDTAKAIDCTWDLVAALVGEPKGEPIWTNGETSSIAAAILSIVWEAPIEYKNMVNVYFFIANMCKPDDEGMPLSRFLEKLPTTHPARSVFAMAEMAHFRTRSSFFVSALGTLKLFTNPFIAEMTSKSDFDLKDLTKEKSILYLILPDEKKTMYSIATLLITQLYMQQVELANKNGGRIPIGFNYFIDEAGNCPMIPILETGTTAGRSRGIGFHLFVQSYFQLKKIYKDSYETIKTNCEVKIHLKADDEITLKEISTRLDTYTVETASASTSISDGKKNDASYSSSAAMTSRALLTPGEVGRFESPDALVMFTSKFPAITKLTDISNSYINELFGLGNETHNQELIMKRESKRKEREIIEMIPLWEIWKMYEIKEEELLFQKPQEQVEVLSPKKKNSFL